MSPSSSSASLSVADSCVESPPSSLPQRCRRTAFTAARLRAFALRAAIAVALVPVLTACGDSTAPSPADQADSLSTLPRALTATEREAVTASNGFSLSLLRAVAGGTTDNVLLSPLSVSLALGMTMNGARDSTLAEMQRTLGWGPRSLRETNTAYRDLMTLLPSLDPDVVVRIGNGIWMLSPMMADTGFARDARGYFGAEVATLPSTRAMYDAVNAWGSRQTDGMVPRALTGEPPRDLVMLLANAVYFAGQWRNRFDATRTAPGPFTLESGAPVTVPMMLGKGGFRASQRPDLVVVELPYGNTAYSMLVLMPRNESVSAFASRLDSASLADMSARLGQAESNSELRLPRFTVTQTMELAPYLRAMGMPRAFDRTTAEFPRLVQNEQAWLLFVKHSMTLEVNERGTRAAAVTVVGVGVVSAPIPVAIDRPFVFLIRERLAGTILFAGVIRNPSS